MQGGQLWANNPIRRLERGGYPVLCSSYFGPQLVDELYFRGIKTLMCQGSVVVIPRPSPIVKIFEDMGYSPYVCHLESMFKCMRYLPSRVKLCPLADTRNDSV